MPISIRHLALSAMLVVSTAPVGVQAAPPAFQASYSVVKSGLSLGEMQLSLAYSNAGYTYQKITKANGLAAMISGDVLTERSNGLKQGMQLRPQTYLHHHKNRRKDRRDQYSFTTPTQVSGAYDNKPYTLNLPAGTIDPALLELRLMEDVAANRPLKYNVTEKGKVKNYQFQRLGKETINVPAGEFSCEKIQMTRDGGERQTTLWLAPELGYAPAQIRHNEEGDIIEARLTKHQ